MAYTLWASGERRGKHARGGGFGPPSSFQTGKGDRPSFSAAARPEIDEPLYERFCDALAAEGVTVARGVFGARMEVALVNDGRVTVVLDA